jgi:hypothetical protein
LRETFFLISLGLLVLTGLLAAGPGPATALELQGTIRNGTTGQPVTGVVVEALNPHKGMLVEQVYEVVDGSFAFGGLSDSIQVYLVRVDYQKVAYSELFIARGEAPEPIAFTVYDTSAAWGGITVSLPNFYLKRERNQLRIEKLFEITNRTDPPRTITGAGIPIFIPDDHTAINSAFTMEHNIPIHLEPQATDDPDIYHIHYPIKPGVTQLALSFTVPYENGRYDYEEPLPMALQLVRFLTDDPQLEILSRTLALEKSEEAHGYISYSVPALAKSALLAVSFSGGIAAPAEEEKSGGQQVIVRPVGMDSGSLPIVIALAVVLIALAFFSMLNPARPAAAKEIPPDIRQSLLIKIARLDDLYAADAVADAPYRAKRTELKDELVKLYPARPGKKAGSPKNET